MSKTNLSVLKKSEEQNHINYAVYVHYPSHFDNKKQQWERASNTNDPNLAIEQAKVLFDSGRFEVVEIKKFTGTTNRKKATSSTYRIFKNARNELQNHSPYLELAILLFSLMAVSYYLLLDFV